MKHLLIIAISLLIIFSEYEKPLLAAEGLNRELDKCIVKTHCVKRDWEVRDPEKAFNKALKLIAETQRTKIIEKSTFYAHAEATTRWMRYIDDLEIMRLPETNIVQIRSESRVGIGDNGVNKKRIDDLEKRMEFD